MPSLARYPRNSFLSTARAVVALALTALCGGVIAAGNGVQAEQDVIWRVAGKTQQDGCADFAKMVGDLADASTGETIDKSIAFGYFKSQMADATPTGAAIVRMVERHGNAAMHEFSGKPLRLGYLTTACLFDIPSKYSQHYAQYFSRKCSSADGFGFDCLMPAVADLADCLKTNGKEFVGRTRCLSPASIGGQFDSRLVERLAKDAKGCFELLELGQFAAAEGDARALLARNTSAMTRYQGLYCLAQSHAERLDSADAVKAMAEMLQVSGGSKTDRQFLAAQRLQLTFLVAVAYWSNGDDENKQRYARLVLRDAPADSAEAHDASDLLGMPSRFGVRLP